MGGHGEAPTPADPGPIDAIDIADALVIPSVQVISPDGPPNIPPPIPGPPPLPPYSPTHPRPRTRRPGLPPWLKLVSDSDPVPPIETARSRRGEPRTVKRRAGGFRAR
jgi:hypothetical protein